MKALPLRLALLILINLLAGLVASAAGAQPATPPETQKSSLLDVPIAPLQADLAGGFAGCGDGVLMIAGSQKNSAAPGDGALSVWAGQLSGDAGAAWQPAGISVPAWAATTQWGKTVVVIGGLDHNKPTSRAMLLGIHDGKASTSVLPPLPIAVAGAGACLVGSHLYVVGGVSSLQPPKFENALWSLDLNDSSAQWTREAPLPGPGRAFAAVTQQYDAVCVFGGLSDGGASSETWQFHPRPPEASLRFGWARGADIPHPAIGAHAFPIGQSSVVLAGGQEGPSAALFPAEAQSPGATAPLLYQTVTDAWCSFANPLPFSALQTAQLATPLSTRTFLIGNPSPGAPVRVSEFQVVRTARSLSWVDYLVIVCYFAFISVIGGIASRKQKSSSDFSLAGRSVPWWVAGISMFATGASAISFMAIPALAFSTNLVFLFPIFVSFLAYFVQSRAIFPLLRRMEITSTYEYLERQVQPHLAPHRQRAVHRLPDLRSRCRGPCASLARNLGDHRDQRLCKPGGDVAGDNHLHRCRRLPGCGLDGRIPGTAEIYRAYLHDPGLHLRPARRPPRGTADRLQPS